MYAIIESGGKQFIVKEGDTVKVEKLNVKKQITFNKVLFVDTDKEKLIGTPFLKNVKVIGEKVEDKKDKKIIVFKKKAKKGYKKKTGHRQTYSYVKIKKIEVEA